MDLMTMKKTFYLAEIAAFMLALTGCNKDDIEPTPEMEIPDIIFDTDLGNSTDDVFAMQALFAYQDAGYCRVKGVMQSRKLEKAKLLIDQFMHYYNADNVPLGLVEGEQQFFEMIPYYQLADSIKQDGKPLFEPTGIPLSNRLPAWKLYRKLLSEADDNSISIVCVGMFTNLGLLVSSSADEYSTLSGKELIKKKVKRLDLMGGCFSPIPLRYTEAGKPKMLEAEYNISGDIPLAQKVINDWPTEIHLFPLEEGLNFPSVHDEILAQYASKPNSPIYQIYSRYNEWAKGDVGQYLWDVITMFHTILGEDYFDCSPTGNISVNDKGKTEFTAVPNGNAHIISMNITCDYFIWKALDYIANYKL